MARVLLAESDRRIRDFIAGILIDCGHAVEVCANGIEAAASLTTKGVDVVVTDLVLSLGQGNALRQNCAALGIPTITLTGANFVPIKQPPSGPRYCSKSHSALPTCNPCSRLWRFVRVLS